MSFRFGTVGTPISSPKKPGGSVGAIIHLHELGLNALELGWVQSVNVKEETCALIKATSSHYDVGISVHAPYFINLNANDDEWPKSRKRLMDAAYYGYLAGATDIIFHPGSYFGEDPLQVLKKSTGRLEKCVDELKTNKIQVTLRPETMGKSAMLGSFEDTLSLSKNIPGVLPCLDFAHLHARSGDGSMNTEKEWGGLLNEYGKALGDSALSNLHIHMSGIEYTPKGEKKHLKIRESDFNLDALFSALKIHNASGRILCESPILEEDAIFMKNKWEELT